MQQGTKKKLWLTGSRKEAGMSPPFIKLGHKTFIWNGYRWMRCGVLWVKSHSTSPVKNQTQKWSGYVG
jgi:hypothetical protein